jgi:hypothetical protein
LTFSGHIFRPLSAFIFATFSFSLFSAFHFRLAFTAIIIFSLFSFSLLLYFFIEFHISADTLIRLSFQLIEPPFHCFHYAFASLFIFIALRCAIAAIFS